MPLKRKFDVSSDKTKKKCLDAIATRIEESVDADVGLITAEDILDIVTNAIGPDIYNQAIDDVQLALQGKFTDITIDLDTMKNQP